MKRAIAAPLALILTALLGVGAWFAAAPRDDIAFLPDNAVDVAQETVGLSKDAVLLTVDGQEVTAQEYLYWLGSMTSYYQMMYSYSGMEMDFSQEVEAGVTWDSQLKDVAYQNAALLALTPSLAKEYGVTLDEDELDELAENRLANILAAGGEAQYAYQMQAIGMDDAAAYDLDKAMALFSKIQTAAMEQTAGALTAQDVAQYVQEADLLRAKHILIFTSDQTTGEPLDEAAKAEKLAQAEDLLAQLRADSSQFDALMAEFSEDPGSTANPDGYLFSAGQMVEPFENATRALEYGQISDVVESDFGYHIILRLDPDCEEVRQSLAQERFNDMVRERVENAQVEKSPAYDSFTTAQYYENLVAFQEGLKEPVVDDQSHTQLQSAG